MSANSYKVLGTNTRMHTFANVYGHVRILVLEAGTPEPSTLGDVPQCHTPVYFSVPMYLPPSERLSRYAVQVASWVLRRCWHVSMHCAPLACMPSVGHADRGGMSRQLVQ